MSNVSQGEGWWQAPVNKWQPPHGRGPLAPDAQPTWERLRRLRRVLGGPVRCRPREFAVTMFRRDVPPLMSGSSAAA